ncbi:hypothetical protein GGS20DRAFT_552884 [Poronia punctata]|nr:hypothetical protein GGS20DRAFT_552884 [Poronia punctata]
MNIRFAITTSLQVAIKENGQVRYFSTHALEGEAMADHFVSGRRAGTDLNDIELDIVEDHGDNETLQGTPLSSTFSPLKGSFPEEAATTPGIGRKPTHRIQSTYSEISHLDPEDEHPDTPNGRPRAVYHFKRYISRSMLNVLAPLFILGFFIFIVAVYFERPAVNGIIPHRPLDANTVFFAWLILSIFVLDWAKSGLAGFEAAALMNPRLAPADARQLMWHADRAWGSVSSWCKVVVISVEYVGKLLTRGGRRGRGASVVEWTGPGPLWFYLAFSSILFYVTVPLSGLSMEPVDAFRYGNHPVIITGINQTTFDGRVSNDLAEQTDGRWRQGYWTTPNGDAIFYAPEGTPDVSSTFFEDTVQHLYYSQQANTSLSEEESRITFFTGPEVAERAHGRAWGLLTDVSCKPVNPYKGLELLQVKEINDWTAKPATTTSRTFGTDLPAFLKAQLNAGSGSDGVWFDMANMTGMTYQYLMATDGDVALGTPAYSNGAVQPVNGTLELVMWQSYGLATAFEPDESFRNLTGNPLVVSSVSVYDKQKYLGYGVRCKASTSTGRAQLSAMTNTFSSFRQEPPEAGKARASELVALSTGVAGMHTLVYSAFTSKALAVLSPPKCRNGASATCNGWVGANKATRGIPIPRFDLSDVRYPTLGPARMALALNKLFGEAAVTAMAAGPGNWTSTPNATSDLGLFNLESANDIVPGRISYGVVIALLAIWAGITVLPQLWPSFLYGRRWGEVLDGFTMFRLGAEWRGAVNELESDEFYSSGAASLRKVPGMIGDMKPSDGNGKLRDGVDGGRQGNAGFVGLSRREAETGDGRLYTYSSV